MRVLIVEDSSFNAFCLTRLLQTAFPKLEIQAAANSTAALCLIEQEYPVVVIVDGDLGAADGIHCNGPALVDAIWQQNPEQHVIAWTDSKAHLKAFADTFKQYRQAFSDATCWPKIVSQERIDNSLSPFVKAYAQNQALPVANSRRA